MALNLVLIFSVALASQNLFAEDCFDVPSKPDFIQVLEQFEIEDYAKQTALNRACREIQYPELNYQSYTPVLTELINFAGNASFALHGATGVFNFMNSSTEQITFRKTLEEIKMNPNRLERILQVYSLVSDTMGPYDEKLGLWPTGFKGSTANPANIVDRAHAMGTGGVCRQHSALLHWSLLQVARPLGEKNMELTENSFSVSLKFGKNSAGGHAWVRVNLPYKTEQGLEFKSFDLDTTYFKNITILNPRLKGIETHEQKRIIETCRKIVQCLSMSKLNSKLTKPTLRSVSSEKKKK